jgi:hypothetical protein
LGRAGESRDPKAKAGRRPSNGHGQRRSPNAFVVARSVVARDAACRGVGPLASPPRAPLTRPMPCSRPSLAHARSKGACRVAGCLRAKEKAGRQSPHAREEEADVGIIATGRGKNDTRIRGAGGSPSSVNKADRARSERRGVGVGSREREGIGRLLGWDVPEITETQRPPDEQKPQSGVRQGKPRWLHAKSSQHQVDPKSRPPGGDYAWVRLSFG